MQHAMVNSVGTQYFDELVIIDFNIFNFRRLVFQMIAENVITNTPVRLGLN